MMQSDTMMKTWRDLLTSVYTGRRFILASEILPPALSLSKTLYAHGAEDVLVMSALHGVSSSHGEGDARVVVLEDDPSISLPTCTPGDMMGSIRQHMAFFDSLPARALDAISAFDPDHNARVIGPIFDAGDPVAGRSKFGAREQAWLALEDKTIIDELWREVHLDAAPSLVVDLNKESLREAHDRMVEHNAHDARGSVFAIDNSLGFHGGASGTRWVLNEQAIERFVAEFTDDSAVSPQRVRVMPFLEGVPCSIHGIVFPDDVVALRPCEMHIYRSAQAGRFLYAGSSTYWEPPTTERERMRGSATRVGEHLRARYGYRGAFTIDGVLTANGFRPTELNPRFGAALWHIGRALPEISLELLQLALVEGGGDVAQWPARELESTLLQAADSTPSGGLGALLPYGPADPIRVSVTARPDGTMGLARRQDETSFRMIFGHHSAGGYLSCAPPSSFSLSAMETFASRALPWLRFCASLYGIPLPDDLSAAPHVSLMS